MLDQTTFGAMGRGSRPAEIKDRDLSLDFAKGILITLVIIGHLLQYIIYRGTEDFWESSYYNLIYIFHMPLFMAISGYVSSAAVFRKPFTQGVRDRAVQLLLPMFVWCAFIFAIKSATIYPTKSQTGVLLDLSKEVIGTYWFIWAAFISFVLVRVFATSKWLPMWIISASAIGIAFAPITLSITPLVRYTYPFYCLGVLFAQPIGRKKSIIWTNKSTFVLLSVISFISLLCWDKQTYAFNNHVLIDDEESAKQVLLMFAGSAAASAVAMQFIVQCWRAASSTRIAQFVAMELGQSTLLVYLVQGAAFRLMDFIQFGEAWNLTTRIAFASVLGVTVVAAAMAIRKIARDLGYMSQILLGAPPRPRLLKSQSAIN
ncbi:nodulation factor fucose acetyltransferase NolL [Mesorhizobium sp. ORM16]|uniref:nodulation factor fucose acetyltransferase NolL n=1 Tax=Mesorhizobium sp. ORM16 TaxID=3376989 RepID=UPI0038571C79